MQLFVDIDGVILDFESSFVRWLNGYLGLELPQDYEPKRWNFTEVLSPTQTERVWHAFLASEQAAQLDPLVCPEHFNALRKDHYVHLVTSFPQEHIAKRWANLEALGFAWDELHVCSSAAVKGELPSKSRVIRQLLRAGEEALFVDDHPDNCLEVHRDCPQLEVWIMSRRFNRTFSDAGIRRAKNWYCLFQRIGFP